jgi:MinD superfamily P-loop ATPase
MIVAVASGKGGTGKTTVAVSLALALADQGDRSGSSNGRPLVVDCDVEAPNAGLFLTFQADKHREVIQPIPEVNPASCDFCGRCAEVCAFHAIAVASRKVLVFPELCHGCGSCSSNCPTRAIREVGNVMGVLERGSAGRVEIARGRLNIGVAMPVPAIRQLKRWVLPGAIGPHDDRPIIVDSPPGTSCPVVESIRDADFVLLVTEPTPFGEHDLRLAVEVARDELGLPVGVVVNRDGTGYSGVDAYCSSAGVPILLRIPHDRRIAEAYSEGVPLVEAAPEYSAHFRDLFAGITALRSGSPASPGGRPKLERR